jgi:hypothetical protein
MSAIAEYDIVEVVRLKREPTAYDGWKRNKRPPSVGERGVVVDIHAHSDGGLVYTVETAEQAEPDWLADFSEDEIRPTGMRHNNTLQRTGAAGRRSWFQRLFGRGPSR